MRMPRDLTRDRRTAEYSMAKPNPNKQPKGATDEAAQDDMAAAPGATSPEAGKAEEWAAFDSSFLLPSTSPAPRFPVEALPVNLRSLVVDFAEARLLCHDYVAGSILTACSGAIGKHLLQTQGYRIQKRAFGRAFRIGGTSRHCEHRGLLATRNTVMMYTTPKEGRFAHKFLSGIESREFRDSREPGRRPGEPRTRIRVRRRSGGRIGGKSPNVLRGRATGFRLRGLPFRRRVPATALLYPQAPDARPDAAFRAPALISPAQNQTRSRAGGLPRAIRFR